MVTARTTLEERKHYIPGWNGDAATFEEYCEESRWYKAGLKKDEQHLVVARLRPTLSGPARRVAKKTLPDRNDCV